MYRICVILAAAFLVTAAGVRAAGAADDGSNTLSAYLHAHSLPLVEAQMVTGEHGARSILLYGYVATEYGKNDAENQARDYVDDPDVTIVNRIKVTPELLTLGTQNTNPDAAAQSGPDATDDQADASADEAIQTQGFPDVIGDRAAYANQEQDAESALNSGIMTGGIPLAMVILGSGAIFPPINPPIFRGPSYYHPPMVFAPAPPVIVYRPFPPSPSGFRPYPGYAPGFPSPFPAGPAPINPAFGEFRSPAFTAHSLSGFGGSFQGGGFGGGIHGGGGFGGHR